MWLCSKLVSHRRPQFATPAARGGVIDIGIRNEEIVKKSLYLSLSMMSVSETEKGGIAY